MWMGWRAPGAELPVGGRAHRVRRRLSAEVVVLDPIGYFAFESLLWHCLAVGRPTGHTQGGPDALTDGRL